MRKTNWKNADYPNAIPSWKKHSSLSSEKEQCLDKKVEYERFLSNAIYNPMSLKQFRRAYFVYKRYCELLGEKMDERIVKIIKQQRGGYK